MKKISLLLFSSLSVAYANPMSAVLNPKVIDLDMTFVEQILGKSPKTIAMSPLMFHPYQQGGCQMVMKTLKNKVIGLTLKNDNACSLALNKFNIQKKTNEISFMDIAQMPSSYIEVDEKVSINIPFNNGHLMFLAPDSLKTKANMLIERYGKMQKKVDNLGDGVSITSHKKVIDQGILKKELAPFMTNIKPITINIEKNLKE